ncbi:hypothetical protein GCM10007421_33930 [Halopseudomonas oceani]|jgi:hypothetical protein|uniref:Uncharacterized protein n=1 Tax=Halopseudomonas oceani TaxID=1708783 RepID=A0A2P4EYI9_9GAMM|nr:hypothetical protein [Halopseudomonas oceani]POB05535.1 hypothetical protein C1949_02260 [Halopseudomonas oceani]GGE56569.1 hypothetical protein GCM10007421_33930 [Halopseudomonas oceani]
MAIDNNRLLLELEKQRREINRSIINPAIPQLSLEALTPLLTMVAQTRKDYLCGLLKMADICKGNPPNEEQISELRTLRQTYDELVTAANALETAIQRDYLDVATSRR